MELLIMPTKNPASNSYAISGFGYKQASNSQPVIDVQYTQKNNELGYDFSGRIVGMTNMLGIGGSRNGIAIVKEFPSSNFASNDAPGQIDVYAQLFGTDNYLSNERNKTKRNVKRKKYLPRI